jgi:transcriptional regulator with XRE-family HTH domain
MKKSIHSVEQKRLQSLLRQIRKEAGLRQSELADRLGKPQSFVSKYESGERRLDLIELNGICAGVGISLMDLVKRFESALDQQQTAQ